MSTDTRNEVHQEVLNYNLANRLDLLEGIFKLRGLSSYYDLFNSRIDARSIALRVNPATIYHNKTHAHQMALNCFEGGYSDPNVKDSEINLLLIAGLYHDADHSYGYHTDQVNVPNAIEALQRDHDAIKATHKLTDEQLSRVKELIVLTYFPYKDKKISDHLGRIVRDADMMTVYTADKNILATQMLGLLAEINTKAVRNPHTYTLTSKSDFVKAQLAFCFTIEWVSQWGKIKALKLNFLQKGKDSCELISQTAYADIDRSAIYYANANQLTEALIGI